MGIDRPYEDDTPVGVSEVAPPEVRDEPDFADVASRDAYVAGYRAKVDAAYLDSARERWAGAKPEFEAEWREYARQHPAPPDMSAKIDGETCAQVERGCKEIRETEENIVTPAMLRIESADPERQLVGLQFRCKGQDRILEKVANWMAAQSDLSPEQALAMVKDPIRYTFQYAEAHYTDGVLADVDRLQAAGFELVELRNTWESEKYRGINSRWCIPENGQLFEVQFHTGISFEAKQLTHPAYERLRSPSVPEGEQNELVDFQRRVNADVPEPQRVREIADFPQGGPDADAHHLLRDRQRVQ